MGIFGACLSILVWFTTFSPAEKRFTPIFGIGVYIFTFTLLEMIFSPRSTFLARLDHQGRYRYLSRLWGAFNQSLASLFGVRRVYYFWLLYFSVLEIIAVAFWMGGWAK